MYVLLIEFEGDEWYSSNNSENNVYFKKYKFLNFGNESFISEISTLVHHSMFLRFHFLNEKYTESCFFF